MDSEDADLLQTAMQLVPEFQAQSRRTALAG